MSVLRERTAQPAPAWLVEQMPPGYQNRVAEIERLTNDLESMGKFGRLLWQTGPALNDAVRDVFAALKLEITTPVSSDGFFAVKLDSTRRLLVYVSQATAALEKKSADLADVFKILQEFAQESDRVVLIANVNPDIRPDDREDAVTPEALNFLSRLGANYLPSPTLFALWKLSFEDDERVRRYLERLHDQDGGAAAPAPIFAR